MEISSDIDSQAIMSQKEHTSLLAVSSFLQCLKKIKIHPSRLSETPIKAIEPWISKE